MAKKKTKTNQRRMQLESKQLFDGCLSVPPLTPRPPTEREGRKEKEERRRRRRQEKQRTSLISWEE